MAYLAMARKWRPRNFEEMVGQDHIAQTIRNAIDGKRISHAYLFTGTRGVGKTTSARILAKALNCEKGPTPTPCDACDNCKAVNNGSSMDVLEIDGASNNSVDNIRDLREQVKYAPMHGGYKIYIIDEVHMLSKAAFNALLKTLEEPPPHVVFIFATTESGKVPHTILSRVQRFDFKRISEPDIRQRLEFICAQEAIQPEREALEAMARKADGSMRDALSLFDQVYAYSGAELTFEAARKVLGIPRESLFDDLINALIRHDQKACFDILENAHREGIETSEFLVAFGEYLRNLLFSRQGVSAAALGLSEARHGELCDAAPELRDGDILRFAKLVSDLLAQIKTASNPRLAVELGFARMASLDRVVTLSQVLGQEFQPAPSGAQGTMGLKPDSQAPSPAPVPETVMRKPAPETTSALRDDVALPGSPGESKKKNPSEPLTPRLEPPRDNSWEHLTEIRVDSALMAAETASQEATLTDEDADSSGMADDSDPDPEDPEMMAALEIPVPRPTEPPDPQRVPVQAGPAQLSGVWPMLVREFITARPLLGSNLAPTRLEYSDGETPELRVMFLERSAFQLIGDDADFKKTIQTFLYSKVAAGDFQVRFALDPSAPETPAGPVASLMPDDPVRSEPIVGFTVHLFDGRLIH